MYTARSRTDEDGVTEPVAGPQVGRRCWQQTVVLPHELRHVVVQLQAIGSHPVSDNVDALRDSRQEQVDVRWRAAAVYLGVVGI